VSGATDLGADPPEEVADDETTDGEKREEFLRMRAHPIEGAHGSGDCLPLSE
jgi:hypothetical protein